MDFRADCKLCYIKTFVNSFSKEYKANEGFSKWVFVWFFFLFVCLYVLTILIDKTEL